jgi:hypothetical protein
MLLLSFAECSLSSSILSLSFLETVREAEEINDNRTYRCGL